MSCLGSALTEAEPPVRAMVVYNSNPGAVAPNQQRVLAGLRRQDLFTVVLEHFQTDTADYADILLPATTQLEHLDMHRAYGHTYAMLNAPAIAPLGESKPNTEIFRLLAARMGFDDACFKDSDEDLVEQALHGVNGVTLEGLRENGWMPLGIGDAPFARGNFPTPSGKCEFYSDRLKDLDPLPAYIPPREDRLSNPDLARVFPVLVDFTAGTSLSEFHVREFVCRKRDRPHAGDSSSRCDIAKNCGWCAGGSVQPARKLFSESRRDRPHTPGCAGGAVNLVE